MTLPFGPWPWSPAGTTKASRLHAELSRNWRAIWRFTKYTLWVTTTAQHTAVQVARPHVQSQLAAKSPASTNAVETRTTTAVPTVPPWLTVWKDTAAAIQSSVTVLGIIAGAIWFLRRRQRFPRANVTHDVKYWFVDGKIVLHTVVRIQNLGEVILRLTGVRIRAQQLLPTPAEPLKALTEGRDPVKPGETEVLWPSICERSCDWSESRHEVEPGEIEEVHFDLVLPAHIRAVEVYTYIKNHVKRGDDIGWGTNTFCAIAESQAFAIATPSAVEPTIPAGERLPIMATNRESNQTQDTQKQQGQKTPTSVPSEKRQGPEKTSTSTTTSTTDKK